MSKSDTVGKELARVAQLWEDIYKNGEQINLYPFDAVVTWFNTRFKVAASRSTVSVIELGCGAGNNVWFLARSGFSCTAIDISPTAIEFARSRLQAEGLEADLRVASFTELPFNDQSFDIVLDRGGLTSIDLDSARMALEEVARIIRPGGTLIFTPFVVGTRTCDRKSRVIGQLYDREKVLSVLPPEQWRIVRWQRTESREELDAGDVRVSWWIEAERKDSTQGMLSSRADD